MTTERTTETGEKQERTRTPEPVLVQRRRYLDSQGKPLDRPQEWDDGEEFPPGTRIGDIVEKCTATADSWEYQIVRRVRKFRTRKVERSEIIE